MDSSDQRLRKIGLEGLYDHAKWIKDSAGSLYHYLSLVVTRPEYETMAQGEIEEAEKALVETLEKVREIKKRYAEKPLDQPIKYERLT